MIKCVNCGRLNVDTAVFCAKCGRRLTDDRITCPNCGTKNPKDQRDCIQCGVNLHKAWAAARREPVTQPIPKPGFIPRRTAAIIANAVLVAVIIVIVILAFTNPPRQDHLQAVTLTYSNLAPGDSSSTAPGSTADTIDINVAEWFQGLTPQEQKAYFSQFRYHNYLVFSTTSYKGQNQTIGALNNVVHRLEIAEMFNY